MIGLVPDRKVVKIKIADGAKQIVREIADRNDMTQEGVAGRIYQWFTEQPGVLQRWILGHVDEELKIDALKKIAIYFQRQVPFSGDGTPSPQTDQSAAETEAGASDSQKRKRKSTG